MNGEDPSDALGPVQPAPAGDGWRRWLREVENLLVSLALAALVLLPLGEIVLRKLFRTGISGATAFEQHLTLLIGLLGGALAAREHRLLTLSTLIEVLKGQGQMFARVSAVRLRRASACFSAWQRPNWCRRKKKPARFSRTEYRFGPSSV